MLATPTIEVLDGHKGPYNSVRIPQGRLGGILRMPPIHFSEEVKSGEHTLISYYSSPFNDKRELIHSKSEFFSYSPSHPRSMSLMCNEGIADSEWIQFQHDTDQVVNYNIKSGKQYSDVVPLFHSHVLWSYAPRITIGKGGKVRFALASVGPHLSIIDGKGKGPHNNCTCPQCDPVPKNVIARLRAPRVAAASVAIRNAQGDVTATFALVPSSDGSLVLPKSFTHKEFRAMTVDGKLRMRLWISVPRSYFALSTVIDLTPRSPNVPRGAAFTVSPEVLRAEKERELCRQALAIDVRNPTSSTMVELLRLLDFIWEAPYGHFPVAKRVAVGVLADMMHLGPHASTHDFVQDTLLPSFHESRINPSNLVTILASLAFHLNTIPGVHKTSVIALDYGRKAGAANTNENTVEKEAEKTPTVPH
ncbi:hypothetical protein PRIPAC_75641 [Pristionchus pacificus]|uniref:Uncharacterized protein n=1 Tax=Pristionchus pacificus TaxID=54126 RepID=A0A2A6C8G5_PRIPA|nr:hypothetical protein PRIPAC_75641 [Pristionchus pacificus]|eukprot:PDM74502.1 hypothetical protein PRIPAC_41858 [Pristionchus pacificus]